MLSSQPKQKRRRGVLLKDSSFNRLLEAKEKAEFENNHGNPYTREQLAEITRLGVDTCDKILGNEIPVDRNSLKYFSKSFGLILKDQDYYRPKNPDQLDMILWPQIILDIFLLLTKINVSAGVLFLGKFHQLDDWLTNTDEFPEGLVPLTSPFYIERSPIEEDCYQAIMQQGALLRLKASRRTGKTSLMSRILDYAAQKGAKSVFISLSLFDQSRCQDLDSFLKTFCVYVKRQLDCPNCLGVAEYWDDMLGSKMNCTNYFEDYLLPSLPEGKPLVLGLDNMDYLFQYPDVADEFFALLRSWHEEGKNRAIWRKLHLIVAHSTEAYIPVSLNHSPFNVGIPIELPEFTPLQVQELSERYRLNWSLSEVEQLMALVGGNPYLTRWTLYNIKQEEVTLEELQKESIVFDDSIYADHLQRQLLKLQQKSPELIRAYISVVMADKPVYLDLKQGFKLESLGLVKLLNHQVIPSSPLYGRYFRQYFLENPVEDSN